MNIKITGHHLDITEAIRQHIHSKLERVNRHSDEVLSMTITLHAEKVEHKAVAHIHLAGKDVHLEAIEKDMYAAIDVLADKIDRAILQHKEKQRAHH